MIGNVREITESHYCFCEVSLYCRLRGQAWDVPSVRGFRQVLMWTFTASNES
jgi:hypothetical protein